VEDTSAAEVVGVVPVGGVAAVDTRADALALGGAVVRMVTIGDHPTTLYA
jgi:hypothetical protein